MSAGRQAPQPATPFIGAAPLLRPWSEALRDGAELGLVAAAGAVASVLLSGFEFGIVNNLFHLPIVGALFDEPQFAADPFIQSLRHFASGFWLLLTGSASWVPPHALFLGLHLVSRGLSILGLLLCASLLGVEGRRQRIVFVTLACFGSLLRGYSYPGNGGLFINYFSHSELANGTVLLTIWLAARGRFRAALVINAVTFFINAFIAVWMLGPFVLIGALALYRQETTPRNLARQLAAGLALSVPIAAPVLWNILDNPGLHAPLPFAFKPYLLDYYPDHILIAGASARHMMALATATLLAAACLRNLPSRSAALQAALVGCAAVFAIGIATPSLTDSPTILELHLLRSSTLIHLVAATASCALATRWLCADDRRDGRIWGPLLACACCTWRSVLPLGIAAIALRAIGDRRGWRIPPLRLDLALAATLALAVWPRLVLQERTTNDAIATATRSWAMVAAWARQTTPVDSLFLVPTHPLTRATLPPDEHEAGAADQSEAFEFLSRRQVWVDVRRGAAAMWAPAYHATWSARVHAVLGLHTLAERLAYARRNGIGYVVDPCGAPRGGSDAATRYRAGALCVYQVDDGHADIDRTGKLSPAMTSAPL